MSSIPEQVGAGEDFCEDDVPVEGPWKGTVPEVPCAAHKTPAIGRASRSNNPLTQQRFTRPPASRAASEHKPPLGQNSPLASAPIGHGSNCWSMAERPDLEWTARLNRLFAIHLA